MFRVLIELTDSVKKVFKETASQLKGAARRRFQAQIVMELGYGGQLVAQKELEWDRNTIRKGIKELTSGIICVDNYSAKGRYKAEEHGSMPVFAKRAKISQDKYDECIYLAMTPEQKQALQEHIQAIAKILYEDTTPERLTSLAGIEEAVRNQMQKHVMPEVGFFLSKRLRAQKQGINDG